MQKSFVIAALLGNITATEVPSLEQIQKMYEADEWPKDRVGTQEEMLASDKKLMASIMYDRRLNDGQKEGFRKYLDAKRKEQMDENCELTKVCSNSDLEFIMGLLDSKIRDSDDYYFTRGADSEYAKKMDGFVDTYLTKKRELTNIYKKDDWNAEVIKKYGTESENIAADFMHMVTIGVKFGRSQGEVLPLEYIVEWLTEQVDWRKSQMDDSCQKLCTNGSRNAYLNAKKAKSYYLKSTEERESIENELPEEFPDLVQYWNDELSTSYKTQADKNKEPGCCQVSEQDNQCAKDEYESKTCTFLSEKIDCTNGFWNEIAMFNGPLAPVCIPKGDHSKSDEAYKKLFGVGTYDAWDDKYKSQVLQNILDHRTTFRDSCADLAESPNPMCAAQDLMLNYNVPLIMKYGTVDKGYGFGITGDEYEKLYLELKSTTAEQNMRLSFKYYNQMYYADIQNERENLDAVQKTDREQEARLGVDEWSLEMQTKFQSHLYVRNVMLIDAYCKEKGFYSVDKNKDCNYLYMQEFKKSLVPLMVQDPNDPFWGMQPPPINDLNARLEKFVENKQKELGDLEAAITEVEKLSSLESILTKEKAIIGWTDMDIGKMVFGTCGEFEADADDCYNDLDVKTKIAHLDNFQAWVMILENDADCQGGETLAECAKKTGADKERENLLEFRALAGYNKMMKDGMTQDSIDEIYESLKEVIGKFKSGAAEENYKLNVPEFAKILHKINALYKSDGWKKGDKQDDEDDELYKIYFADFKDLKRTVSYLADHLVFRERSNTDDCTDKFDAQFCSYEERMLWGKAQREVGYYSQDEDYVKKADEDGYVKNAYQKSKYIADWLVGTDKACKEDKDSKRCVRAESLGDDELAKRAETNYFTLTEEQRSEKDSEFKEDAIKTAKKFDLRESKVETAKIAKATSSEGDNGTTTAGAFDGNPETSFVVTAKKGESVFFQAEMETYSTISGVSIRTANTFKEAILLQGAEIMIGDLKCGNVPDKVDEATYYLIQCTADAGKRRRLEGEKPITSNAVRLESETGLALSDIQVSKAEEQDKEKIGVALFEEERSAGGSRCEYDGKAIEENPQGTRPVCETGQCCGVAHLAEDADKEGRKQVEICAPELDKTYNYKESWDASEVQWMFTCIESANKVVVGAAAAILLTFNALI